jgi:hypothetical protein
MRLIFILSFCSVVNSVWGQSTIRKEKLPKELHEISGLEKLNDSILVAINDGGNSPMIYFLDLQGNILKRTCVSNAVNRDWEDLAMDDKRNLYIADVGNNSGKNTAFFILKLSIDEAFTSDSIECQTISFTYPAGPIERTPDCEAIFWCNGSLHLLTKNHMKYFKDVSGRYKKLNLIRQPRQFLLSDSLVTQSAIESPQFFSPFIPKVNKRGIKDLVTAADQKDSILAVLTYKKLYTYSWKEKTILHERRLNTAWGNLRFMRLTQKEAVVIMGEKNVRVAAERHRLLGGPYLYTIQFK